MSQGENQEYVGRKNDGKWSYREKRKKRETKEKISGCSERKIWEKFVARKRDVEKQDGFEENMITLWLPLIEGERPKEEEEQKEEECDNVNKNAIVLF